ncbi:MAG: peptide ABC transporter permease [Dehalococcoidia bacterium]|nr:ABC transporter permease [Tepidiformaceae bacterium]
MAAYVLRRVVLTLPVLLLVLFGSFALLRLIPGSAAELRAGAGQSQDDIARLEKQFGLDDPIPIQFANWVGRLLTGDLGESIWSTEPVADEIKRRFPPTAELALLGALFAVIIAVPAGTMAALNQDRWIDRFLQVGTAVGIAIPNFFLATLVIMLPARWWGWTPPTGYISMFDNPVENLQRMALPAMIIGLAQAAVITRLTRSSLLEVLRQDYIRTARAKGLAGRTVVIRHSFRNAMVPIVTIFGLQFATLLGGSVIIESVFSIPGMGAGVLSAIGRRDYDLAQTLVLIFGLVHILSVFITDMAYTLVDPRIKYT